jgi:hypothetical protein
VSVCFTEIEPQKYTQMLPAIPELAANLHYGQTHISDGTCTHNLYRLTHLINIPVHPLTQT